MTKREDRPNSASNGNHGRRICFAVALLLGCAPLIATSTGLAADARRGGDLAEQWCNACHSIGGGEPRQEDAGPQFAELAKRDADYLRTAINRPHDFMPDFPQLSTAAKADLIAYIRTVD